MCLLWDYLFARQKMACLLPLVPLRILRATTCFILVHWHNKTCPQDRTYGSSSSDSIFYQLVLCGFPDPLTGHSTFLHTLRAFVGKRGLTIVRTSRYFRPASTMWCLWIFVTLCASVRFTCFHLHKVLEGLPLYILRTGSGRTDRRDVYGVIR